MLLNGNYTEPLKREVAGEYRDPADPELLTDLSLVHLCVALQLPLLTASNLKKDIVVKSLYFTQLCPDT